MNYSKLFLFILIAMATLIGSCKKDEVTSPTSSNYMTATISGDINLAFSTIQPIHVQQGSGFFSQTVLSGSQAVGALTYNISLQLGSYEGGLGEITPTQSILIVTDNTSNISQFVDYTGNMNITKNDNSTIEGTFSFDGSLSGKNVSIKNGKFAIKK